MTLTRPTKQAAFLALSVGVVGYAVWRLTRGRKHANVFVELRDLGSDISNSYSIFRTVVL